MRVFRKKSLPPRSPPRPSNTILSKSPPPPPTSQSASADLYASGSELVAFLAEMIAHVDQIYSPLQSRQLETSLTSALTYLNDALAEFTNHSHGVDLVSFNRSNTLPPTKEPMAVVEHVFQLINKVLGCLVGASIAFPDDQDSDDCLEQVRLRLLDVRTLFLLNVRHMI